MTKSEFATRFMALVKDNTNLEECTAFLNEAQADYTASETATTTLSTLKDQLTKSTEENARLKETNYQLFLQGFSATPGGSGSTPDTKTEPEPEPDPNDPEKALTALLSTLKGETTNGNT